MDNDHKRWIRRALQATGATAAFALLSLWNHNQNDARHAQAFGVAAALLAIAAFCAWVVVYKTK